MSTMKIIIKPITKEEVVRVKEEIRISFENITSKVERSMRLCDAAAKKYAINTKK